MPSPEFFNVQPVADALQLVYDNWQPRPAIETIDTRSSVNRIVAEALYSSESIPPFRKSTVDGYAVIGKDTFGASQSLPVYLNLVGEVQMGEDARTLSIGQHEAIRIHTGGMLPDTANAVVMIEYTQSLSDSEIEVLKAVAPGENVIQIGEDVQNRDVILQPYHRIRPQDIGGLLAVGLTEITVFRRPRIGILSCGDELVEPSQTPSFGQIRDINAHTLAALINDKGGDSVPLGIAPDTLNKYIDYSVQGFSQVDVLVLTAGSSVSSRDYTRDVITNLGQPGVLQHGLATKPGKPTILAVCNGKPVIGLPGNPVSALLVARQILPALIARYTRQPIARPLIIQATLSTNIASVTGREDWVAVRLTYRNQSCFAEPVFGKSNLIYTLIQADGLICIPINSGGLNAGTEVEVIDF
jgi:molybdopterin molybdotransferase